MKLSSFFEEVVQELRKREIPFAVVGGLIASLYREHPRATKDLDILIFIPKNSVKVAEKIIRHFHLKPHFLRKADLEGGPLFAIKRKSTAVWIVSGVPIQKDEQIGLDLILSEIPWAESALKRAQKNQIDFGFGTVPCITVEDLITAKLYALQNQSTRFMDLDDLKSIFQSENHLDLEYLSFQMKVLKLSIPPSLASFAPKELTLITKKSKPSSKF